MKEIFTALLLVCAGSGADRPRFDRMYVFGDSYSDTGAGYVDGNGPTAVAYLAQRLGLNLAPSNAAGKPEDSLNFAVSGAGTGRGNGRKVKQATLGLGMRNQVDDFAARVRSHALTFNAATTLFFLAGGLNDKRLPSETTVDNLKSEIRTLYESGGRRFAIAILPTAIPNFSEVGMRLTPELARIPREMATELPDAEFHVSHWGAFFDEVIHNPEQYGIRDTKQACAGREIFDEDTTPCPAPAEYYYYHSGHPSTAVHKAVGAKLFAEVSGWTSGVTNP